MKINERSMNWKELGQVQTQRSVYVPMQRRSETSAHTKWREDTQVAQEVFHQQRRSWFPLTSAELLCFWILMFVALITCGVAWIQSNLDGPTYKAIQDQSGHHLAIAKKHIDRMTDKATKLLEFKYRPDGTLYSSGGEEVVPFDRHFVHPKERVALLLFGPFIADGFDYTCCSQAFTEYFTKPFQERVKRVDTFVVVDANHRTGPDFDRMYRDIKPAGVFTLADPPEDHITALTESMLALHRYLRTKMPRSAAGEYASYHRVYVTSFATRLKTPLTNLSWFPGNFHFLWRELSERGTAKPWEVFHAVSDRMWALPSGTLELAVSALRKYKQQTDSAAMSASLEHDAKTQANSLQYVYDFVAPMLGGDERVAFLTNGLCHSAQPDSFWTNPILANYGPPLKDMLVQEAQKQKHIQDNPPPSPKKSMHAHPPHPVAFNSTNPKDVW
eukprot:CAMPEP_0114245982 /NCGR_PEP_ID=MMETSP0058-20121206/12203_1 /TAXON_ID=36894 /ORGANISM="Pyramimonas parkeae, CCMP726" /LENGTH=443 /DNA_ID=CAMNT_0001359105 /DNA_START=148 /DNA_END=1476 /DNA_ORIENTATION=+